MPLRGPRLVLHRDGAWGMGEQRGKNRLPQGVVVLPITIGRPHEVTAWPDGRADVRRRPIHRRGRSSRTARVGDDDGENAARDYAGARGRRRDSRAAETTGPSPSVRRDRGRARGDPRGRSRLRGRRGVDRRSWRRARGGAAQGIEFRLARLPSPRQRGQRTADSIAPRAPGRRAALTVRPTERGVRPLRARQVAEAQ